MLEAFAAGFWAKVVAFVTDMAHRIANFPNYVTLRLHVTYHVIGNPHYPYVIVDLGLQLSLGLP